MKIIECEQGTPQWIAARLGRPSASNFDRLVTPATRKPSAQAHGYVMELLAEWLLGQPVKDAGGGGFMGRGSEFEARARAAYEFEAGAAVERVGYCLRDDETAGCSPDGFVGRDGLVEIKVHAVWRHVAFLLDAAELAKEHAAQAQGQLWITGRAWVDLYAWHPTLPAVRVRVTPDAEYHAALAQAVAAADARIRAGRAALLARGIEPRKPAQPSALNEEGMPW